MNDIDDFFAQEAQARAEADSHIKEEQILKAGDFFLREAHGFNIYGIVLDPTALLLRERPLEALDEEERAEYEDTKASYEEPHMRFYRFTSCFSKVCPRGELGDTHLSTVRKITEAEFLTAKKAGWP